MKQTVDWCHFPCPPKSAVPIRHWNMLVAKDFFTVEVWTNRSLQRMVLFFIDVATRKVEIAGITPVVNGLWMNQVARSLTDPADGVLSGRKYLRHDPD